MDLAAMTHLKLDDLPIKDDEVRRRSPMIHEVASRCTIWPSKTDMAQCPYQLQRVMTAGLPDVLPAAVDGRLTEQLAIGGSPLFDFPTQNPYLY
jgi:hypothetical protein